MYIRNSRHSIRLRGYDYSQNGLYFVTICIQHMGHIMGKIENNKMVLNDVGKMMDHWWNEIPKKFDGVELDVYQIMPNHLHANIKIVGADLCVRPNSDPKPTLGTIIQWFKTMTTNEYLQHVKKDNWEPFPKRVWQRNFYEHIIRNEQDYDKICYYIIHNPEMWERDRNNLNNII